MSRRRFRQKDVKYNATDKDTVEAICAAIYLGATNEDMQEGYRMFREQWPEFDQFIRGLYRFLCEVCDFAPDNEEHQTVRTLPRIIEDKKGNCVDFVVYFGTWLTLAGVPFSFVQVATDPNAPDHLNHIYICMDDGTPLDPTMHFQRGLSVDDSFGKAPEKVYKKKIPFVA